MKKLTLSTSEGRWRLLALFAALIILFSACGNAVITGGYKFNCKTVTLDVQGASLSIEQYEPRNISSDSSIPCVILFHGGSESLSATSMVAWEFARRGFVVLNVSMYSCGLSEQPAVTDDGTREENYFRGGAQGMYDALKYARNISYVDPSRIGLWAHSAGVLGCGTSISLDESYLTLNDRMLNILHDTFDVEITEEQLTQNADEIAQTVLSEEQLAVYQYMKVEQQEICDTYVHSARVSPSSGCGKTVTVAGHEVVRDPQLNLVIGVGVHEDGGYLTVGETDKYKANFHTGTEAVQRNGWYAMPDYTMDPEAASTYLGQVFETNITNSPELAEAVKNGTARLMYSPNTFHNGILWDDAGVSETVEFFTQTMGYNNGNIGDPDAKPIDTRSCGASYWNLAFTTLSFLSAIGLLAALMAILLQTKFFASCALPVYEARITTKDTSFYLAALFSFISAFFGVYMSSDADLSFKLSNATATKWLPWEPGQVRTFVMIICTAAAGYILFLLLKLVTRGQKGGSVAGVKDVHLAYGWKNVGKTVLIGVILFTVFYVFAAFIKGAFSARFMSADNSFEMMHAYGFMRMVKYTLILLPFCLIISVLNNLWSLKNVSDSVDTLINVIVTSFGAELVVLIALILTFSTPGHGAVFNVHTLLSVIVLAPVMNYIYRKFYKLTGSVWAGALVVAIILGWRLSSYISHQFIYWGPDPIKAFWGIY